MTEDAKFWLLLVASFFGGGIVGWGLTKIEEWWRKPRVVIEYGSGYPFIDTAKFADGGESDFVRVRVRNSGRKTAERCKCYVRNIKLKKGGKIQELPTANLMLASWVPREEGVTTKNIPPKSEFFADVAYAYEDKGKYTVAPVFNIQNFNVSDFTNHVGDFELEFVVLAENLPPASRVIQFSFDGKSTNLLASA